MSSKLHSEIVIQGAKTHNLRNVSLNIPHHKLIVVTGISGSGKSSLVFDIIAKEGQRRYFESLPTFARQFMGKLNRPEADKIEGLAPVIAISQSSAGIHSRSTVGTMSDLYDSLRLLFARTGKSSKNIQLTRALFSFNSTQGKCPQCQGIGKEEQIDLERLIAFPDKTIRDGALAPTLPNGYIMYSQVTMEVLNKVCIAEGFNVDLTWEELNDTQKKVILFGSEKLKVPFGKHSLESRLKWTGIKAKPREEGYYRGLIPIMSDILHRDRNANILKYVRSVKCEECQGSRLNSHARSVKVNGKSITNLTSLSLLDLSHWSQSHKWNSIAAPIVQKIEKQIEGLAALGLGHLTLDRSAKSLSPSEIQRIRIANQMTISLTDVLYVFDEPSIGLHREENRQMISFFKRLVNEGNTVIVVEHDLDTISQADHIIDIGPRAGIDGGQVLFNGSFSDFINCAKLKDISPTHKALTFPVENIKRFPETKNNHGSIRLEDCMKNNLKAITVDFQLGKLNVVSGKSGTGKSSLIKETLLIVIQQHLGLQPKGPLPLRQAKNLAQINKLVFIDHSPIGKTPRSNPATYLGLSDHIRDVFARLPEAKSRSYTKSRFSFNNKGGRCEACQGAGKIQIGMHFLGNVDMQCEICSGRRFNDDTLLITYSGLTIAEVYKLSIDEAILFFHKEKKILCGLNLLKDIGLGYLTLGQSSSTLSGGEAQRIKIANQLQKKDTGDTLYIIIEPSIGLHHENIQSLLGLFDQITERGNTIVCIDQKAAIIQWSDWHIELGPKSGSVGGSIVHQGQPRPLIKTEELNPLSDNTPNTINFKNEINLLGVTTHTLQNIDVKIPKNQLTVVTGVSGSGKSSLVYDTLFAEAHARFSESLSTYNRSFIIQNNEARLESSTGLSPAIGINRKGSTPSKRSTVGTYSGIYDAFRLLFSRIAQHEGHSFTAQHYSFNHHLGACHTCKGLGIKQTCDPELMIIDPDKSVFDGAIADQKAIQYYADPNGQFMATLKTVAKEKGWNLHQPWSLLDNEVKQIILYGTGTTEWQVTWEYKTKSSGGKQSLLVPWLGLCHYIDEEYQRKLHNKNIKHLEFFMHAISCLDCHGSRLKSELLSTFFLGKNIHELSQMSIEHCIHLIEDCSEITDSAVTAIAKAVIPKVKKSLQALSDLGLGYLNISRSSHTLSGGERQRLTLASQLSAQLYGVVYVLDEPTIGLDTNQVKALLSVIRNIIANGNTVVVMEHDVTFIQNSDYVVEMGPKSGRQGGNIIYQGQLSGLKDHPNTATHKLLHQKKHQLPKNRKPIKPSFGIKGARAHNLKQIDLSFSAQQLTAITGVSGSGKSSLIREVIYGSWSKSRPYECTSIYGFEQFENVKWIDHEKLTGGRASTPATYSRLIELINDAFSKTEDARNAGFKKADFSYLSKNGKCPTCAGIGKVKTSMDFMSDIWLTCDSCYGFRYNKKIMSCLYQGRSIGEVMNLNFVEAKAFFDNKSLQKGFELFEKLGIGHLSLGQASNTLSGGERQRLKLASALLENRKGSTLFLIDEPSTGLHYVDLLKLISTFESIVNDGHTIIYIEHNQTMIEYADSVFRLGPGSGVDGGSIVIE